MTATLKNFPEGSKLLGRQPVRDLCTDDVFLSRNTKRPVRLICKDYDGVLWVCCTVADLETQEVDFIAIDHRASVNVWAV